MPSDMGPTCVCVSGRSPHPDAVAARALNLGCGIALGCPGFETLLAGRRASAEYAKDGRTALHDVVGAMPRSHPAALHDVAIRL